MRSPRRLPARKAAAVGGVIAAFVYVLLAGFQIPAQRTLYMLTVAAIGLWLGRPGTASVVWLWALAVVLASDPWASLTPGFWLSFGAVGLLLYIGVGRIGKLPDMARSDARPGGDHARADSADADTVPADIDRVAAGQCGRHSGRDLRRRAAGAGRPSSCRGTSLLIVAHQVFAWVAAFLEFSSALPAAVWQQHAPPAWAAVAGVSACSGCLLRAAFRAGRSD